MLSISHLSHLSHITYKLQIDKHTKKYAYLFVIPYSKHFFYNLQSRPIARC